MIDVHSEILIALADVPAHLPKRRGGKRPHTSCIYRWAQTGCRGVVLETLQCGGTKVISLEALQRFFDRLTEVAKDGQLTGFTSRQLERARRQAKAELDDAGL